MGSVFDNLRVLAPFFAVPWIILLISVLRKPQRLRNSYLLMIALLFSALMLTGFFGEKMPVAIIGVFLLAVAALFCVPVMLIINGIQLIKREGFCTAHFLSLALGIIIAIGEIAAVVSMVMSFLDSTLTRTTVIIATVFITVFYFSFHILAFVLYVLFIQIMPHRMKFDYVIIHGAGLIDGNKISRLLANRIDKAIEIYHRCKEKPILIPSGGKGIDEDKSEAEAISEYLLSHGIPRSAILTEDKSTTTMENLVYSNKLIEARGGNSRTALVSSNYHVYRCVVYASQLKMRCIGIGAKVAFYYWPSAVLRECAAIYSQKKNLFLLVLGYAVFVLVPAVAMFRAL